MKLGIFVLSFGYLVSGAYSLLCLTCDKTIIYPTKHAADKCASKRWYPSLFSMQCPELSPSEVEKGIQSACYKVELASIEYGPDNETFNYQRGCTKINGDEKFCYNQYRNNSEAKCSICTTNLCNSASDQQIIRALLFFVAIIIVLYMQDQRERNHLRDSKILKW